MKSSQVYRHGPEVQRGPLRNIKLSQSGYEEPAVSAFQTGFQAGFQRGESTAVDPIKVPGLMTARASRVVNPVERG